MSQQDDDYLIFERVGKKTFEGIGKQDIPKKPIEGCYASLYDELLEKCNPALFICDYNKEKIMLANKIYSQLVDSTIRLDIVRLKLLRSQAIKDLGIQFCTETLYNKLIRYCHPSNFTEPHYDARMLEISNNIYYDVINNAHDIEVLENCEKRAEDIINIVCKRVELKRERDNRNIKRQRIKDEISRLSRIQEKECMAIFGCVVFSIFILSQFCIQQKKATVSIDQGSQEFMLLCLILAIIGCIYLFYKLFEHHRREEKLKKDISKMSNV